MMGFERRWARQLLAAFAPDDGPGLAPEPGEVDYAGVIARMAREATPFAAIGLRAAIWLGALAPLWLWGKLVTVSKLTVERRTQLLRELIVHRWFVVRELATLLKLAAAMALLGAPAVRARSGYDQVQSIAAAESDARVRLQVLGARGEALAVWSPHDGAGAAAETARPTAGEAP